MPQVFKIGPYWIYFWADESKHLEPIHVHVSAPNATKIWITSTGKCLLCHNKTRIPDKALRNVMRIIEARADSVVNKWRTFFGEVKYYC